MYVKWTWYEKPIKILNCFNFDTHTHTLHLTLLTCQVLTTVTAETSRKVNISSKWLVCVPQPVNNQVSSWLWVLGTIQATNVYVYQLMGAIKSPEVVIVELKLHYGVTLAAQGISAILYDQQSRQFWCLVTEMTWRHMQRATVRLTALNCFQ